MISLCNERSYGSFIREVAVGPGVEDKDVKATMEHG